MLGTFTKGFPNAALYQTEPRFVILFQLFVCCSTARAIILEFLYFVNRKN